MRIVESEEGIDPAVRRPLADLETYGEPFFERYTSLAALIEELERSATMNVPLAHLAVAYAVDGNPGSVPISTSARTEPRPRAARLEE